jgi:hypothetical protein
MGNCWNKGFPSGRVAALLGSPSWVEFELLVSDLLLPPLLSPFEAFPGIQESNIGRFGSSLRYSIYQLRSRHWQLSEGRLQID